MNSTKNKVKTLISFNFHHFPNALLSMNFENLIIRLHVLIIFFMLTKFQKN